MKHLLHIENLSMVIIMFVGAIRGKQKKVDWFVKALTVCLLLNLS